jgi:flavin-dependent dehydrogenase
MDYAETIIVGGGPAGSSCAWQLNRQGREVLVLDKQAFPRLKLCAGWVPAKVIEKLGFSPQEYPHSIVKLSTGIFLVRTQGEWLCQPGVSWHYQQFQSQPDPHPPALSVVFG